MRDYSELHRAQANVDAKRKAFHAVCASDAKAYDNAYRALKAARQTLEQVMREL